MHKYNLAEGELLVRAAKNSIELFLRNPHFDKAVVYETTKHLREMDGIFITLEHHPTGALRGCIGFPTAVSTIGESVIDAAIAAAFEDPRFVPVSIHELDRLAVEVSILSKLEEIGGAASQRYKKLAVGEDGVMVKYGLHSGLLLPIVAVQQGWDAKTLLKEACIKAGLDGFHWLQPNVKVYKFQTQVFREESPGGGVIEVETKKAGPENHGAAKEKTYKS